MVPTGPVVTPAPWGSFGVDWENVTRYDDFIREAADPVGWPIERIRAHIMIESQGFPDSVQQSSTHSSYGLMQIVPYGVGWEGWHELVKEKAGLPGDAPEQKVRQALADPRINILTGVTILDTFYVTHGSLDAASSVFITGTPDWGRSAESELPPTTSYWESFNGLIAEQVGASEQTNAAGGPEIAIA
jgi:hypothetical protein